MALELETILETCIEIYCKMEKARELSYVDKLVHSTTGYNILTSKAHKLATILETHRKNKAAQVTTHLSSDLINLLKDPTIQNVNCIKLKNIANILAVCAQLIDEQETPKMASERTNELFDIYLKEFGNIVGHGKLIQQVSQFIFDYSYSKELNRYMMLLNDKDTLSIRNQELEKKLSKSGMGSSSVLAQDQASYTLQNRFNMFSFPQKIESAQTVFENENKHVR